MPFHVYLKVLEQQKNNCTQGNASEWTVGNWYGHNNAHQTIILIKRVSSEQVNFFFICCTNNKKIGNKIPVHLWKSLFTLEQYCFALPWNTKRKHYILNWLQVYQFQLFGDWSTVCTEIWSTVLSVLRS